MQSEVGSRGMAGTHANAADSGACGHPSGSSKSGSSYLMKSYLTMREYGQVDLKNGVFTGQPKQNTGQPEKMRHHLVITRRRM